MNKQELIEKYKNKYPVISMDVKEFRYFIELWEDMKQLDEPQKQVVPQFVGDWIEYCKNTSLTLKQALMLGEVYFYSYANQEDFTKLKEFLKVENNQELFARAWLDGYEVEEEKRYLVKVKGVDSCFECLYYGMGSNTWSFRMKHESGYFRQTHTRKELEEAGFGEVFNSPLFEVEEAE
ncbi:DUF1642 domain-containing protein [Streptococcus parasanguinis]|uniref:DUF1642 domain-containing protein n=1 Tax=Streptococcus parasanguinis TaxID=1318 RepID=UPI00321A9350